MTIDQNSKSKLIDQVADLMQRNRRRTGDATYTVPSPDTYPYQWLWDSCFHAIILRHIDAGLAQQELSALFAKQFDDGMLPHMIYWQPGQQININWGIDGVSTITQPPIVAYAVEQVYETSQDRQFLERIYPSLTKFYEYLLRERVDETGLAAIINPDESGEDNSPRFDGLLNLPAQQTITENMAARLNLVDHHRSYQYSLSKMRELFWVYDVPFNALLVENLQALARLATAGMHHEDARRYQLAATKLQAAMKTQLADGSVYRSIDGLSNQPIQSMTWAIFIPLAAGLLAQVEADQLINRYWLESDDFSSEYGLRTVAASDPAYDPEGFWRGPVWPATNWFMARGLQRYGYRAEAADLVDKSQAAIAKSGFREYFHPETGEGLGAHDFTWGGLLIDMLEL